MLVSNFYRNPVLSIYIYFVIFNEIEIKYDVWNFGFSNCVDYDLCEECENINGIHDHTHVFIKLRRPIKFRQRGPLMKQILYKPYRLPTSPEESTDSQDKEDGEETVAAAPMVLDEGKKGKILARIEKYDRLS